MLRPARLLGRLTSPRRRCTLTGPPVYGRACSNRSLPQPESAITTRPNHLLPRRDSHPFMYQRTKAAPEGNEENEGKRGRVGGFPKWEGPYRPHCGKDGKDAFHRRSIAS